MLIPCDCGCGEHLEDRDGRGRPRRYVWGHNPRRDRERRFWEKVAVGRPDECWPWAAARDHGGYGRFDQQAASRVAYSLTIGDPGDLDVLHTCDNPPCCNPLHLFAGTTWDNMHDASWKGRMPKGDQHWTRRRPEHMPYMRSFRTR